MSSSRHISKLYEVLFPDYVSTKVSKKYAKNIGFVVQSKGTGTIFLAHGVISVFLRPLFFGAVYTHAHADNN